MVAMRASSSVSLLCFLLAIGCGVREIRAGDTDKSLDLSALRNKKKNISEISLKSNQPGEPE
jgi:hypothetical protein